MVEDPEWDVEDVLPDEWELVDEEEVLVDLRLAELTVPLEPEEPLPAEPVDPAARVKLAPAGTTAAEA